MTVNTVIINPHGFMTLDMRNEAMGDILPINNGLEIMEWLAKRRQFRNSLHCEACQGFTYNGNNLSVLLQAVSQKTGLMVVATIWDQGSPNLAATDVLLKETNDQFSQIEQKH